MPVEIEIGVAQHRPAEAGHRGACILRRRRDRGRRQQTLQGGGQRTRHRHVDTVHGIAEQGPEVRIVMYQHRQSGGHGLDHGHAETLVERRRHQQVGGPVQLADPARVDLGVAESRPQQLLAEREQFGVAIGVQAAVEPQQRVAAGRRHLADQVVDALVLAIHGAHAQHQGLRQGNIPLRPQRGTRAGGLVRWRGLSGEGPKVRQFLRPQDPIGGNTVNSLAVDASGRVWMATDGGLSVLDDRGTEATEDDRWQTWTVESSFGGLPSDDLRAVAVGADGETIWVGGAPGEAVQVAGTGCGMKGSEGPSGVCAAVRRYW